MFAVYASIKRTGPKEHYFKKVPARRTDTFKSDRPEELIRSKGTSPKGHYVQKGTCPRPLRSKSTGPRDQYVKKDNPDGLLR
jgi:hypothetical protein